MCTMATQVVGLVQGKPSVTELLCMRKSQMEQVNYNKCQTGMGTEPRACSGDECAQLYYVLISKCISQFVHSSLENTVTWRCSCQWPNRCVLSARRNCPSVMFDSRSCVCGLFRTWGWAAVGIMLYDCICSECATGWRGRVGTHQCYGAGWLDDDDADQHTTSTASWTVVSDRSVVLNLDVSVTSSGNTHPYYQKQTVWPEFIWVAGPQMWNMLSALLYLVCLRRLLKTQLFNWGCSVHSDFLFLGIHLTYWRSQEMWQFILYNNSYQICCSYVKQRCLRKLCLK